MNATKLTTRVVTMALAFAGSACQSRGAAAAADPAEVLRPAEAAVPPAPPVPVTPPSPRAATRPGAPHQAQEEAVAQARAAAEQMRDAAVVQREAMKLQANTLRKATVAASGGGGGYGGSHKGFTTILGARIPMSEAPAVLTTEPTDDAIEEQWLEDLKVMDALLRNATGGSESSSFVLGVKMMNFGRTPPMYVEGAGVVFSYNVGWPLAPSGKA